MHTNTTPWSFLVVRMTGSSLYGSITAIPSNFPLVIWMAGPGQNKCCLISGMVKRPSSVTGKEGRKIESRWVNVNMTYRLPHDQHQELPHRGCPSWIIAAPLKKIVKDIIRTQNHLNGLLSEKLSSIKSRRSPLKKMVVSANMRILICAILKPWS